METRKKTATNETRRYRDIGAARIHERVPVVNPHSSAQSPSKLMRSMREEKEAAHRLAAYSDAVFAVIVTVMVLELRAPDQPVFSALLPLWPTAFSYLFIAIIWINHHYRASAQAHTAHGAPPITRCPGGFHERYAGCVRRATPRFRPDMRRSYPALVARGARPRLPWFFTQLCSCASTLGHGERSRFVARIQKAGLSPGALGMTIPESLVVPSSSRF